MAFGTVGAIPSGRPYRILSVMDGLPATLDQFVGDSRFAIEVDGAETWIQGCGFTLGSGVRFHEKDVEHTGKDVRLWQIDPAADGAGFSAATVSLF